MKGPTFELERNDSRTLYLDVTLPPSPPYPIDDLNDFDHIRFTLKRDEDDPDSAKVLQKTKAAGQITVEAASPPVSGTLAVAISAGDLSEKGRFVWDVEGRVGAVVTTLGKGNIIVDADVTVEAP